MAYVFDRKVMQQDIHQAMLSKFGNDISNDDLQRLRLFKENWDMYEGFHWENIPDNEKPQVTVNYCRAFVNKFVSFEFGKGFSIKMNPKVEGIGVEEEKDDEKVETEAKHTDDYYSSNPLRFLNEVWEQNGKDILCTELGQSKGITGEGWVQVYYESKDDMEDPFGEFEDEKGKIGISVVPSSIVFPEYGDPFNKDKMTKLSIMYPIEMKTPGLLKEKIEKKVYKQIWTPDKILTYIGQELRDSRDNKYGVIPFVQIKNYPLQGKNTGISDIEDVKPLNIELNLKKSDVSEIIDYHSAPVTVVFGARIGQLERGAGKVWGGLPKDAKIENLALEGNLDTANTYIADIKQEMAEVGNVPLKSLGGELGGISNTSGTALQIALMPIIEKVQVKHASTKKGLSTINKLALHLALKEGLIEIPEGVTRKEFFQNEIQIDNPLPKDMVHELEQIEQEMILGMEDRAGGMKRLNKDNIQHKIKEIDQDREKYPEIYGLMTEEEKEAMKQSGNVPSSNTVGQNKEGKRKKINSGFNNGPEPKKK